MKRKVIFILKGVLLWMTASLIIILIVSLESIIETNPIMLIFILPFTLILIRVCYDNITDDELKTLSGYTWFEKFLKG